MMNKLHCALSRWWQHLTITCHSSAGACAIGQHIRSLLVPAALADLKSICIFSNFILPHKLGKDLRHRGRARGRCCRDCSSNLSSRSLIQFSTLETFAEQCRLSLLTNCTSIPLLYCLPLLLELACEAGAVLRSQGWRKDEQELAFFFLCLFDSQSGAVPFERFSKVLVVDLEK